MLLKLCFRDLDAIASWFVLRNLCGRGNTFPVESDIRLISSSSSCPISMFNLSSSLKKSFTYIEPGMICNDNEVRQIIVAWLPFLFLSNLSKTFSKPFLLALSSPSLFICMKAILLFVVTTGTRLVCRLCCLLCTCVTTTSTGSICRLTSTDASCRYWNRRIGNQKAASGQGIRKAYTHAYTN